MHPPLTRPHPHCQEAIKKLLECHEEHKVAKFFGSCTQIKFDLDKCFKMEKEYMRRQNMLNAKLNEDVLSASEK